jgi:hypothetical protein
LTSINSNYCIQSFVNNIYYTVAKYNAQITTRNTAIWPASIHTLFLDTFGLKRPYCLLDNSPNKIGKKMYGTEDKIYALNDVKNDDTITIILNGAIFNGEIIISTARLE